MHFLTFVLHSTLLAPLVEFITSSSGHVEPRQGVALGWLGSVVAGLAVVFGTADRTQADDCHGIPVGSCGWVCTSYACKWDHEGNPRGWNKKYVCHQLQGGCQQIGGLSCTC